MKNVKQLAKPKRAVVALGILACLLVVLALVWSTATGQAGKMLVESQQPTERPEQVPNPGMGSIAFKVVGSVVLLICILYAGMYAMRVLSGRGGKGGIDCGAISVLHRSHIAPKKAIYVLKVGEKAMVLGVTESQITHLSDLSREELGSIRVPQKSKAQNFKRRFLGLALGVKEKP